MSAPAPPEIGGIVHLDHVNFEVVDQDMATAFFCNGLGLTRDPFQRADETNMGINVGMEQFHLPRRGRRTPPFNGEIGMVVPRLDVIALRLERLRAAGTFEGTPFAYEAGRRQARIVSPYGFVLRLHQWGTLACQRPLAIAYVEVAVPPGTSAAIARFYREIFRAPVSEAPVAGSPAASVGVGPYQAWRFVETPLDDHATHSMHVSYYMTDFESVAERLAALGAAERGSRPHLYFFNRIVDPATGAEVFRINNEVRSLYHPDFRRPLANRWPMVAEPFSDAAPVEHVLAEALGEVPGTDFVAGARVQPGREMR